MLNTLVTTGDLQWKNMVLFTFGMIKNTRDFT